MLGVCGVGPVTFVHGALARPGGRAGGKGGAATMQPGQGGWPLAGSYETCEKSASVAHMHGLNVSVAWKKKAACVGGAGAWKLATTACASLGLGPWRFAAGTMVRRRGGYPMIARHRPCTQRLSGQQIERGCM